MITTACICYGCISQTKNAAEVLDVLYILDKPGASRPKQATYLLLHPAKCMAFIAVQLLIAQQSHSDLISSHMKVG